MTAAVNDIIRQFDSLTDAEKGEAIAELLRRQFPDGDLSQENLTEAADELFRQLDAAEGTDAHT